jgi:hypothetical protein
MQRLAARRLLETGRCTTGKSRDGLGIYRFYLPKVHHQGEAEGNAKGEEGAKVTGGSTGW